MLSRVCLSIQREACAPRRTRGNEPKGVPCAATVCLQTVHQTFGNNRVGQRHSCLGCFALGEGGGGGKGEAGSGKGEGEGGKDILPGRKGI